MRAQLAYAHVIFDLDGTLVDSASEIHAAAAQICAEEGLCVPTEDYIRSMTGAHPAIFFRDHGADPILADSLVKRFRDLLRLNAGDPDCVFEPVPSLLEGLQRNGVVLSLATTKPSDLADLLLRRYGLRHFFRHVQGTDPPLRHKPHPDILNRCLDCHPATPAVMVGDTVYDVQAAAEAGIHSIALCSGTQPREHLENANPTYILENHSHLAPIFGLGA